MVAYNETEPYTDVPFTASVGVINPAGTTIALSPSRRRLGSRRAQGAAFGLTVGRQIRFNRQWV
jgi:hypothetical protein